jgi:FAD/FMN-containing dehydrogenase
MGDKKGDLIGIVGRGSVLEESEILEAYSRDQSFVLPMRPSLVVKPDNADEVEEIVKWANQTGTPLVPVSSGPPRFRGDTVPSATGVVIVDLSGMNRVISIDRRNRLTVIEPGVTYGQLQPQLAKEGLKLSSSLAPRANKSVIASLMEREPRMIPRGQWAFHDPLRCLELVLPDGQRMRTGDAGGLGELAKARKRHLVPVAASGPYQMDAYKLVSAAQGSMGIATWASVKCEVLPQVHKVFFVQSRKLEDLIDFVYKLLRFRFADELMILNGAGLASLLGDGPGEIKTLREELPLWVVVVGIAGRSILPEQRVAYQEQDISDIAQQFGLHFVAEIPGARNSDVSKALNNPSKEPYWKCAGKGGFQDIFFLATLNKTPGFLETLYSVADAHGYPASDIGIYLQPVHQGTGCHCEFILPYDPGNPREAAALRELFAEASQELLNRGGFFSRPYGIWAGLAYNRDAQSTIMLKKIKSIFDPNNVMNPGKLCF